MRKQVTRESREGISWAVLQQLVERLLDHRIDFVLFNVSYDVLGQADILRRRLLLHVFHTFGATEVLLLQIDGFVLNSFSSEAWLQETFGGSLVHLLVAVEALVELHVAHLAWCLLDQMRFRHAVFKLELIVK